MKRRSFVIAAGCLAGLLSLGVLISLGPRTSPGGRRLSAWFADELARGPGIISVGVNGVALGGPNRTSLKVFKEFSTESVPFLIDALHTKDSASRNWYIRYRAHLPGFVQAKLPMLYPAAHTRATAAYALAAIGPPARDAVPALTECLIAEDTLIRRNALVALASIGPDASEVVPVLKLLLQAHESEIQRLAAIALARIDSQAFKSIQEN